MNSLPSLRTPGAACQRWRFAVLCLVNLFALVMGCNKEPRPDSKGNGNPPPPPPSPPPKVQDTPLKAIDWASLAPASGSVEVKQWWDLLTKIRSAEESALWPATVAVVKPGSTEGNQATMHVAYARDVRISTPGAAASQPAASSDIPPPPTGPKRFLVLVGPVPGQAGPTLTLQLEQRASTNDSPSPVTSAQQLRDLLGSKQGLDRLFVTGASDLGGPLSLVRQLQMLEPVASVAVQPLGPSTQPVGDFLDVRLELRGPTYELQLQRSQVDASKWVITSVRALPQ